MVLFKGILKRVFKNTFFKTLIRFRVGVLEVFFKASRFPVRCVFGVWGSYEGFAWLRALLFLRGLGFAVVRVAPSDS